MWGGSAEYRERGVERKREVEREREREEERETERGRAGGRGLGSGCIDMYDGAHPPCNSVLIVTTYSHLQVQYVTSSSL